MSAGSNKEQHLIDWGDDGFAHPQADVTRYVDGGKLNLGLDLLGDARAAALLVGEGTLALRPRETPDGHGLDTASLTDEQLRRPHDYHFESENTGVAGFDGKVVLKEERRNLYSIGELLTFDIRGHGWLGDGGVMTYPRGVETEGPAATAPDPDPADFAVYGSVSPTLPSGTTAGTGTPVARLPFVSGGNVYLAQSNLVGVHSGGGTFFDNIAVWPLTLGASPSVGSAAVSGSAGVLGASIGVSAIWVDGSSVRIVSPNGRLFSAGVGGLLSGAQAPGHRRGHTTYNVIAGFKVSGEEYLLRSDGQLKRLNSYGFGSIDASLTDIGTLPALSGATWLAAFAHGSRVYFLRRKTATEVDLWRLDNITRPAEATLLGALPTAASGVLSSGASLIVTGGYVYALTRTAAPTIWRLKLPVAQQPSSSRVLGITRVGSVGGGIPANSLEGLAAVGDDLYLGTSDPSATDALKIYQVDPSTGAAGDPDPSKPPAAQIWPGRGLKPTFHGQSGSVEQLARFDDGPSGWSRALLRNQPYELRIASHLVDGWGHPEDTSDCWCARTYCTDVRAWRRALSPGTIRKRLLDCAGSNGQLVHAEVGATGRVTTYDIVPRDVSGMVWDGTKLWLIDRTLDAIYTFEQGTLRLAHTLGPELEQPTGLAFVLGRLYTLDRATNALFRINLGSDRYDSYGIEYLDESSYGASPLEFIEEMCAVMGVDFDRSQSTDPGTAISGLVRYGPAWPVALAPTAYRTWTGCFVFATRNGSIAAAWPGDIEGAPVTLSMRDLWVVEPLLVHLGEELIVNDVDAQGWEVLS